MDFLILVFATYCVTHLLVNLDGPMGIFFKLRRVTWLGALHCFTCTTLYVSALMALYIAHTPLEWIIYTLGIVGGAIITNELIERI